MPRRKNAQGAGTIRKRSDGRWEGRYTVGFDPATGKQIQRSIYGKTQKEVKERLAKITVSLNDGTYLEPSKMTVSQWLDIWQREYLGGAKPHTRRIYESAVERHIKPALGRARLQALTPVQVQKFVNQLVNQKDGKPLSPKTVRNIHGVLHSALQQAARIGYLKVNPADLTILPKRPPTSITPLQDDQVGQFLVAIKGHPYENLYSVDLFTGLRQSELLGLKWEDVDFEHGAVAIRRQLQVVSGKYGGYQFTTPKNNKTRQIVPARFVMDVLRRQRRQQIEMRLAAGPAWDNKDDLVFTNELGAHLKHEIVYRRLKRVFVQMGCPNLRFHDLRHGYAVMSIQAGDDIKTVQENLGHYSAAFTLDVYGHVTDRMKKDSSERMDRYIHALAEGH